MAPYASSAGQNAIAGSGVAEPLDDEQGDHQTPRRQARRRRGAPAGTLSYQAAHHRPPGPAMPPAMASSLDVMTSKVAELALAPFVGMGRVKVILHDLAAHP